MSNPHELFQLFVEISVALLGFTGVVAAFGGRSREFTELEQARLLSVFSSGVPILVCSLSALIGLEAQLSIKDVVRIVGIVGLIIGFAFSLVLLRSATRYVGDENASTDRFDYALAIFGTILVYTSLFGSIFFMELWMLLLAFSSYLLSGLWVFFRLLTRLN